MPRKKRQIRAFSIVASMLMVFSLMAPGTAFAESAEKNNKPHEAFKNSREIAAKKVNDRLQKQFKDSEQVTFLVKFKEKADSMKVAKRAVKKAESADLTGQKAEFMQRSAVISELKSTAMESQRKVKAFLQKEIDKGNAANVHSYHIVNGMAVTATKEVAENIAGFEEVEKILPNETRTLFKPETKNAKTPESEITNVEWHVERVNAPETWEMGIDGSGTVVASIDTGVQWDHPALKESYRGFDASTGDVDHDYNWFDATAGESEPYDDLGHGTHVTGTMVGHETDGSNQVGVAPGAEFISVKAFTEAGGTDVDLLEAAEWIMAPTDSGGNARADLAPDVVNNSWGGGPGLDEWYRDVVINWRAAEIFPEFSAGNTGLGNPGGPGSVAAPANYPESFATGATDSDDNLAGFSLEGPSPYEEIKPDISAPGAGIRSSVPGDGYGSMSGTSMAGPAVSAVAALLRQVDSSITVDEMEQVLMNSAIPLTDGTYPESPNNGFGHGLVNAYDAVSALQEGIGTIEGQVTKQGEDNEAPVFDHTAPTETYAGMGLDLNVQASDNISVASVELQYQDKNGEWQTIDADRVSGDFKEGAYLATIPGEQITEDALTYKWTIRDFGNNDVTSDDYTVKVKPGISTGYSEDFENTPAGWTIFGENSNWELGAPTSGPGKAVSGENVYATGLDGDYNSDMNATLVMPPIDMPEGEAYLQFEQWYNLEKYDSGRAYDFGHVFVSTDQEEWTQLMQVEGKTDGWESAEVDLSEYSGQRIYIGFNVTTDGSVTRDGWYIDDAALSDTSQSSKVSKGKNGKEKENSGNNNRLFTGIHNGNGLGLGVIKSGEKAGLKEKVDPDKIKPALPKKEAPPAKEGNVNPDLLPMNAEVSVLESGRSVATDPATGEYSMSHASGTFTLKAESYGFESKAQNITLEADSTVQADFTLDEVPQATVSGTITDEQTGEPVEGATVLLKEDANVTPVESDENGNYSITGYEGTYTLKVMAADYHSKEVDIMLDDEVEQDIALEPFYTYPGGEIGYDDGTVENARAYYDAGNKWAVKMSLPGGEDSAVVTDGVFQFYNTEFPNPGGTEFAVEVWDASGTDGMPGEKIAGPVEAEAIRDLDEWTVVDLSEHNITVDDDFYMVYVQTGDNPNVPGLATDESSPNAERSYQQVSGTWSQSPSDEGNYMIRSRVSYEVEAPVITAPEAGLITNGSSVTVEGTASPTTTVQLLNNGEETGAAEVGNSGEFSIPADLTEGANELKAVSVMDGAQTGESEPITVTLDTAAPEITVENPEDGDKTNRETVTVEGTVEDANLDTVDVNGRETDVAENGSYSQRILLDNGENKIDVTATDMAGNTAIETAKIDVDFVAPKIENLTPTHDKNLAAGESVRIEFDSEPGQDATFFIHMPLTNATSRLSNATELPLMEMEDGHYVGYWTATSNVVGEGAAIEVKVVDAFDNETRQTAEGKLFINTDDE
ncbi:bacillopeptidase F [Lentibacillus kapialis]|uniref:Bacillopeptidase F n=1 Tax=Lentibacillus kapialis TaxID=340214 RepID=A0A917PYR2_9BACI|nr:S8 family peptidase [Lentibacillus kapialis]GGJ99722.1 bacillopeptidase F [Lentibacillus kapialis]